MKRRFHTEDSGPCQLPVETVTSEAGPSRAVAAADLIGAQQGVYSSPKRHQTLQLFEPVLDYMDPRASTLLMAH